jgi:hypothetical protein
VTFDDLVLLDIDLHVCAHISLLATATVAPLACPYA